MPQQMIIKLTRFHSVKVQFNKSLLSTEIRLKCILDVDKKQFNQSQNLEEANKQLLTNEDQVIMQS